MASHGTARNGRGTRRQRPSTGAIVIFGLIVGFALLASGTVGYLLWPRWPENVATDAPSLPITVAGVFFNVPPAAIRMPVQRRPGSQERIDLAFLWPSLTPPDPAQKPPPAPDASAIDRIFVTIARNDGTLPPEQRLNTIYAHYAQSEPARDPNGLLDLSFRSDSPYKNEDLFYDPAAPDRFLARCSRNIDGVPGMCLFERRIEQADVTVRFPRDWLANWRDVAGGVDRLIEKLRPAKS